MDRNKNSFLTSVVLLFIFLPAFNLAQQIERIEPPHWYVDMNNPTLQLLIYGDNIQQLTPQFKQAGIKVNQVHKVENPNYLFVDIVISDKAKPQVYNLVFTQNGEVAQEAKYELKSRRPGSANRSTFSSKDVIYLITPDRFANGDYSNDEIVGMKEGLDMEKEYGRHGGDIKGIIDHLDYIHEMGFTSIWLNPVLENNQDQWSYHGYSTTDYYKIDPRFGTMEEYLLLSKKAKEKGIGLVMDMIANHCGGAHWWMKDLPTADWVNYQGEPYQQSNHRKSTVFDPYVDPKEREIMTKGWFVPSMPDLNQKNPFLAKYLIQNSIWWIEYADLQGIRQDTYSYPFKQFMADWTCAIDGEYPGFNIVGEEWVDDVNIISYWQKGKINQDGYTSCLRSLMDFPLNMLLPKALGDKESFNQGLIKIYEHLARDNVYPNPMDLMVFGDNHDMSRIYEQLNHDFENFKMAMALILTTRGIPQIFYGTEILMDHPGSDSHGKIRKDFPGGWQNSGKNGFTQAGLNKKEIEAQEYLKALLNWRKESKTIHKGKLMHYSPIEGTYVYFRYDDQSTIMIILNKNKEPYEIDIKRFSTFIDGNSVLTDVLTGEKISLQNDLVLQKKGAYIFTVK